VASNILMHREYMNAFPANFNIERGQVRTENSNKPHGFGLINPETFSPFPKNPVIARFFREIGRADELGSGVRRLMKYGKAYGGNDPELIEGDVFRIIVKYPDSAIYENDSAVTEQVTPAVRAQVEAQVEAQVNRRILLACAEAPLSLAEIAAPLGHKQLSGNLRKALPELRKAGFLEYTIPDKPNSRLQKYRLTYEGKRILRSMQEQSRTKTELKTQIHP
jgi:ATP-dependent DNA helicase RecG